MELGVGFWQHAPMPQAATSANLVKRMRDAGIRVTGPRRAIAQVLEQADEHLDVDEITEKAKTIDPSVHRATVYRTLGMLKTVGLVDELDLLHFRGDRHYYEIRTGSEHAHVICTGCGEVLEPAGALIDEFRSQLKRETGYDVQYIRMEISGLCARCASAARRA